MLKEKIQVLDVVNQEVLAITETRTIVNSEFKRLKKELKKIAQAKEISHDEYLASLTNLKTARKTKLTEIKTKLDDSVTYLVNQYEEFIDYKVSHELKTERAAAVAPIQTEIESLKTTIQGTTDKKVKIKLKDQLQDLKISRSETKTLYSKTIKNKSYLVIGLLVILSMMLGSLLLAYLYVNKDFVDFKNQEFVIGFILTILSLALILSYLAYTVIKSSKKWVLDRQKNSAIAVPAMVVIMSLDTLGVGSYATATSVFKKAGLFNDDKKIPGTLNAGIAIPGLFGGILTFTVVPVQIWTLIAFVGMCLIGTYLGSLLVRKINAQKFTLTMGIIISIATVLMFLSVKGIDVIKSGTLYGLADSENWWKLIIGMVCFAGLGMFLSFGVGIFAPAMVVVSLLGMDFVVVFPIMMLCAGFSGQVSAYASIKHNMYLPKTSWAMSVGGMIGEFVVFAIVYAGVNKAGGVSLNNLSIVFKWVSVPVIGYAAFLLFRSYFRIKRMPLEPVQKAKKHLTKKNALQPNYLAWFNSSLTGVVQSAKIDYPKENQKLHYRPVYW